MANLNRLVLVRHGETVGQSSIRYYGITDVVLSREGRRQAETARSALAGETFDRLVASPLVRAWQTATILSPLQKIEIEENFREVDFGEWEGLTQEEIEARDPALYDEWQSQGRDFNYPGGEARAHFRKRVERGLQGLLDGKPPSALVVAHKGVIRVLVAALRGEELPALEPHLGAVVRLGRGRGGDWRVLEG